MWNVCKVIKPTTMNLSCLKLYLDWIVFFYTSFLAAARSVTRDEVEDSNAEISGFFNNKEQKPPRRGKTSRQAEDWSTVNMKLTWRRHMKDNGSAQDCRHKENYIGRQTRVTRETQLEPLKQWLSNKMGGDRQSTWEHMAPNKQQAMCSTDRDIWWPAWAHQQDRDITPPLRSGSQTLHTH